MIKKATKKDIPFMLQLLRKEPLKNLFLIGDIEQFGHKNKFMTTFINKDQNEVTSVILIYGQTLLFYDPFNKIEWTTIWEFILKNEIKNINVSEEEYNKFASNFKLLEQSEWKIHKQTVAVLNHKYDGDTSKVQKATLNDVNNIVNSLMTIKELKEFRVSKEKEIEICHNGILLNISHPFIIKNDDNEVIAHAKLHASTKDAGMIGGVFCINKYRRKGYATQVTGALCNYIIDMNIKPILFFDNPNAAKMYYKIGFEDIGKVFTISKQNIKEKNA
ncbi:GNAT family N-acetyltransferase [Mycoplasmopsis lipofaciens]|uniref:GNAT family N-acetyltransferase n=1 Tax=Mycoplasmopsis lipofaciens TaxID=114884 RepID=UPI000480A65C|nr:GNAT family N-acetyltransferase [Mycoplasmopsis lipofaciens]